MSDISSKDIIKVLTKNGFKLKSTRGRHVKFVKNDKTVIVPHPKKSIKTGTFLSIVRQSGLSKFDF